MTENDIKNYLKNIEIHGKLGHELKPTLFGQYCEKCGYIKGSVNPGYDASTLKNIAPLKNIDIFSNIYRIIKNKLDMYDIFDDFRIAYLMIYFVATKTDEEIDEAINDLSKIPLLELVYNKLKNYKDKTFFKFGNEIKDMLDGLGYIKNKILVDLYQNQFKKNPLAYKYYKYRLKEISAIEYLKVAPGGIASLSNEDIAQNIHEIFNIVADKEDTESFSYLIEFLDSRKQMYDNQRLIEKVVETTKKFVDKFISKRKKHIYTYDILKKVLSLPPNVFKMIPQDTLSDMVLLVNLQEYFFVKSLLKKAGLTIAHVELKPSENPKEAEEL